MTPLSITENTGSADLMMCVKLTAACGDGDARVSAGRPTGADVLPRPGTPGWPPCGL
jgi:hypothetical protein